MFKRYVSLVAAVLALALSPAARCDARGGSLPPSRSEDPRLAMKISLASDRIPLGALLEGMAKQSGVSVSIDERDTLSAIPVFVQLKEVPLDQAMSAVWSLLSYPGAPWRWEHDGRKGQRTYTLVPSIAAHTLAARVKAEARRLYDDHVQVMMRVAQMSPEERKKCVKEVSRSFLTSKEAAMQSWLDADYIWEGLRTFAESASPELQAQVVHGEAVLDLSVSKMSPAGRSFLDHYMKSTHPNTTSFPEFESVRISASSDDGLVPTMYITPKNTAGFSFLGGVGLDMGILDRIGRQWLLPGDAETGGVNPHIPASPLSLGAQQAEQNDTPPDPVTRAIKQLAEAAPVQVLALLADEQPVDPGPPYGLTLEAHLKNLHDSAKLAHKWRGSVLLLGSSLRFADDELNIPYRLIKRLSTSGVNGKRPFTLPEMAEVLSQLSARQFAHAATRYEAVRAMQPFAPLLAAYSVDRDLGRISGLPLTRELLAVLARVVSLPANHPLMNGQAERLRIAVEEGRQGNLPAGRIKIEYMTPNRKWTEL